MGATARRVLVTGGGSGIGLAVARAFAGAGYETAVAGRGEARLKATGLPFFVMDVTDAASVEAGVAAFAPDIFIANAGGARTAPAMKMAPALWDEMIALNLTSVFLCARAAIPPMTQRGFGRFIAIASTAGLRGYAYAGAYAAAKHGVVGWIRSLALEIAKTGVTANALCPSYTDTPMIDDAAAAIAAMTGRDPGEAKAAFAQANPMGRLVDPKEVAAAALWLAGDGAAAVNGQAIAIDGGETAG
jgi:NAD(P)-dependent dehydrogenase (short-subunit alcohol dehydrogenase family)